METGQNREKPGAARSGKTALTIRVRLFASLRGYGPPGEEAFPVTVREGASVEQALRDLAIPDEVQKVVLLNGRHATMQSTLQDGDVLTLFPPVEGG
jgi:molybdopterin converting factor small subunit